MNLTEVVIDKLKEYFANHSKGFIQAVDRGTEKRIVRKDSINSIEYQVTNTTLTKGKISYSIQGTFGTSTMYIPWDAGDHDGYIVLNMGIENFIYQSNSNLSAEIYKAASGGLDYISKLIENKS